MEIKTVTESNFKHLFTQEQRDSLWQYFIDHSKIQRNGYYGIIFYIQDEDDFYKRLYARYSGNYQRYDKLEKMFTRDNSTLNVVKNIARKNTQRINQIKNSRNYWLKALLFIQKKLKAYIFN